MNQSKPSGPSSQNRAMAVLIIDDSEIDRATMSEILSAAGFQVHVLPSPIGATRIARQLHCKVVVIDQNLPAMDGTKLAALFRHNPGMRETRVVLVSGSDDQGMLAVVKDAQVDAFVSKRHIHEQLVPAVKKLM